jgi:ACS family tartrate transporter-like MFS transporter
MIPTPKKPSEIGEDGSAVNTELETRVLRKITWRIVPFIMALYFVSFINRVNVGFAALTMNRDLGLTSQMFGFGVGIFFVGYLVFGLPSNLVLNRIGARRMISGMIVTCGLLSGAMAFANGEYSFYALRFAVGLAEAGFFPGAILYLSFWFPARHRTGITAIFMAAVPLSNMFSAPISGAIMEMTGFLGLKGWQWLFLLEAAPTVLLGLISYFYLTDKPAGAKWLKPEERNWLVDELAHESASRAGKKVDGIWPAIRNIHVLGLALVYFGTSTGLYAIGIWTPLFLSKYGYSYVVLGLLAAIPNIVATIGMVGWGRNSDRHDERILHCALACLAGGIGMLIAGLAGHIVLLVVGLCLANLGTCAAKPPLWSMPTQFLSGSAAAAAIGLINAVGSLGGAICPIAISRLKAWSGSYSDSMYYVAATLIASSVIVACVAPRTKKARA